MMTGSLMSSNISQSSTELVNVTNIGIENKSCKAGPSPAVHDSVQILDWKHCFRPSLSVCIYIEAHITNIMLFIVCIHILSILDSIKFPAGIQSSHQHRQ